MSAAIFFDFTLYRLKAANDPHYGPVRWWDQPDKHEGPWWETKPATKDTAKEPANKSLWDWLTK